MEVESPSLKLFRDTCRTCMCKEEPMSKMLKSIFMSLEDQSMLIVDVMKSAIPQISIDVTDALPKEICTQCLSQVQSVYQFQQACISSDRNMRDLLHCDIMEAKFSHAAEICQPFGAPTEDPFRSVPSDPADVLHYDGELKDSLKLEATEEETNAEDLLSKECANTIEQTKVRIETDVQPTYTVAEHINTDNKMDESNESEDPEWKAKKPKRKIRATKKRVSTKKAANIGNSIEEPNAKRRRKMFLPCQECGKIFDRSYSLRRHMNVHKTMGKPHECAKCKYRFSTKAHLKRHEIIHDTQLESLFAVSAGNPEGYKCGDCPRRFAKRESLSAHRQSHCKEEAETGEDQSPEVYACPLCPKKFKKLNMLTRHSRNHEENKHFKCHLCDKTFGLNAHLIDHLNKHNGIKPYVCNFCNKAFQQSCTLKDHMRTHTGEQPFLCSECGKAFNSSSNMKQHLLRHTGEKRYECPECPKKFPCLSDLASHMAVHRKLKPHICDICSAAFGKPYQLKKHKMYHNGDKPHKCEYCEKRFVCADHMRRHMRTHTGEKPYKCKYCDRAFAQSNDLIKHLRSHLGENVYKCELCPQAFRLATELREHFAEHKNNEKDAPSQTAQATE